MTSKRNVTKVDIITGFDPICQIPEMVRSAGLACRVAIIQHTYRAGWTDMYFDLPLWERILEFAMSFGEGCNVHLIQRDGNETRPGVVRVALREARESDREPPEYILVREGGRLVLCVATEYWAHVGGPAPYADSYTYSIFTKEDVAERVRKFLADVETRYGWEMSSSMLPVRKTK